jgi:hypothetical protein
MQEWLEEEIPVGESTCGQGREDAQGAVSRSVGWWESKWIRCSPLCLCFSFKIHGKSSRRYSLWLHMCITPLPQFPIAGVHLLLLVPLHWPIITQSSQFTLGVTLGVEHSMGLDKCTMMCIPHYDIIKEKFHCLKSPLCSTHSSLPAPYSLTTSFLPSP